MNWLRRLLGLERDPEPWQPKPPQKRNGNDVWLHIIASGEENPDRGKQVSFNFEATCLGKDRITPAVCERFCVYCKHFNDPVFTDPAFPDGGGHCDSWNGAIGFTDGCKRWERPSTVRWWLSKRYMARNAHRYPTPSGHRTFDDGPDGDKS